MSAKFKVLANNLRKENDMKNSPIFEAPSVLTHKIELEFGKYQSESSLSIAFTGSHLVHAHNNDFQRFMA